MSQGRVLDPPDYRLDEPIWSREKGRGCRIGKTEVSFIWRVLIELTRSVVTSI